jgi:microcystin-dependent protein
MEPSYVGAIWMFGGNFAPRNFHFCDGSLQSIAENEVLYVLLGTTYGGDGVQTFGLPDLRGRAAIGAGTGPGLSNYVQGQMSGSESVTFTTSNMAGHTHLMNVVSGNATALVPTTSSYLAQALTGATAEKIYSDVATNTTLNASTVGTAGNSIPANIMQPILAVSYVISLFGIFPSQN